MEQHHRRPPRGGRGLKYLRQEIEEEYAESPPSRGAWIEISILNPIENTFNVAPLAGGVD